MAGVGDKVGVGRERRVFLRRTTSRPLAAIDAVGGRIVRSPRGGAGRHPLGPFWVARLSQRLVFGLGAGDFCH